MTVFGKSASSMNHKMTRFAHVALLDAGQDSIVAWRHSVRGYCSDQGVERKLADMPNVAGKDLAETRMRLQQLCSGEISFESADDAYFLQSCLTTPSHLHIFFDALE